MNQLAIFNSLVRNAFDFLERAIGEFDKAPKYSVIHFCAAVEMLLKARLMKEHWSLIVSKPEQANLAKFIAGDFVSVTMDEARNRLRDIASEGIADAAFNDFREIAKHRNKMIHFFHDGLENDGKEKAKVVAEQCRAWLHLHRLLNLWGEYFYDYRAVIERADRSMKKHRKYLKAKFDALSPELAAISKAGMHLKKCTLCGFKSAQSKALDNEIATAQCLVCDHVETQVKIECSHCKKSLVVSGEGHGTCNNCNGVIKPENLVDALTDHDAAHKAAREGDDSWQPANCGNCDGYHTVVTRGDTYFCASCFEISDQIEQCDCCNEWNTGDMEQSYSTGCNYCDG